MLRIKNSVKTALLLLLIVVLCAPPLELTPCVGADDPWHLPDFQFRKKHIITGSTAANVTDYIVGFKVYNGTGSDGVETLGTTSYGKFYVGTACQPDFDDVRFVYAEGGTTCPYVKYYNVGNNYAFFFVKIPQLNQNTNCTIYAYYGNATITDESQDEQTFFVEVGHGRILQGSYTSNNGWSFIMKVEQVSVKMKTIYWYTNVSGSGREIHFKFFSWNSGNSYKCRWDSPFFYTSNGFVRVADVMRNGSSWETTLESGWYAAVYVESGTTSQPMKYDNTYGGDYYDVNTDVPVGSSATFTLGSGKMVLTAVVGGRAVVDPEPTHGDWGSEETYSGPSNKVPTIGNFEAPATVYANKYFLFNATVNDGDGTSDLANATVQLSNSVVLKWTNITDAFSVDYDPNGYCTLDASGCFKTVLNDTALKLTWKIKLGWAYPEGFVSVIATNTKVFDNSGASGSGSYANLFVFEDDLIVYSASCSEADNRTGCGQPLTFNGTIYYEGTTTPPESFSGVTAHVGIGNSVRGSTTIFGSDGSFSITVQAESTVGFYIYTVYATTDEATMENQTFGIVVDKLSITVTPSKLKANLNEQVTISWTIKRAYDDSVCSDFVINLQRDGQLWAENLTNSTITDVSSLTTQHVYTVSSALDNTYGITVYDVISATVSWGSLIPSTPPTIRLDIQPINLGEVQATATVNFTITATFDMQRITITKIEFQAESTWFKILTSLPKTYDKEVNAWGTATIDAQLTLPATATGTYTIPFIIYVTLPDGTKTQANSYITLTAKTSTLSFTTDAFIETIKRLLGNPIILLLLIALIMWLSAYSLKKH